MLRAVPWVLPNGGVPYCVYTPVQVYTVYSIYIYIQYFTPCEKSLSILSLRILIFFDLRRAQAGKLGVESDLDLDLDLDYTVVVYYSLVSLSIVRPRQKSDPGIVKLICDIRISRIASEI